MATLFDLIEPAVTAALRQAGDVRLAAGRPPAGPSQSAEDADGVASRTMDALRNDPALAHATNDEPWYRSRVTVGAILSALAPCLGLIGFQISPESRDLLVGLIIALGGVVGPALTLYGRWIARRPLGM